MNDNFLRKGQRKTLAGAELTNRTQAMRAESHNWHFCCHGGEAPMAENRKSDLIDRDRERNQLKINIEHFICLESLSVRAMIENWLCVSVKLPIEK